jgi:hypothetical protein
MLAVNNSTPSFQLQSPQDLEVITIQLRARSNIVICLVYVPPNSDCNYCTKLFNYLSSVSDTYQTLILGDFNTPDICWSTLSGHSSMSRALCNFIFRYDLSQLVNFPTHTSGNILDLILSPPGITITELQSISWPTLQSDHLILSFNLPLPSHTRCSTSPRVFLDYKKADFNSINSSLLDHDFSPFYQSNDIEFLWQYLKDTLLPLVSLYTPVVRKHSHTYPKWFNSSIKHQLHKVHSLRKKHKRHPSSFNTQCLSSAESTLQSDISTASTVFESRLSMPLRFVKTPKSTVISRAWQRVTVVFHQYLSTKAHFSLLHMTKQMYSTTFFTQFSIHVHLLSL